MANLSELARGVPADEVKAVHVPKGSWYVTLQSGKLSEEKQDDDGNEYLEGLIVCTPTKPFSGVDSDELSEFESANGYAEARLFHREGRIMNSGHIETLTKKLKGIGVPTSGRTLEEIFGEIGGQQAILEVSYQTNEKYLDDDGKPRVFQKTKLYSVAKASK